MDRFNRLSDEIVQLQRDNVPPESEKCQQVINEYWGLVMEFTNGDAGMLPKLMKIGSIDTAANAWEERQKIVNDYLEPALPAHIKPMEAIKLFAKWNRTKIDDDSATYIFAFDYAFGHHVPYRPAARLPGKHGAHFPRFLGIPPDVEWRVLP